MESNMVEYTKYISNEEISKYIIIYFEVNLKKFLLISSSDNGRYFEMNFSDGEIDIFIKKEIGFWIEIVIDNTEYELWRFDKSVNSYTEVTKQNILYQLEVLKRFLV